MSQSLHPAEETGPTGHYKLLQSDRDKLSPDLMYYISLLLRMFTRSVGLSSVNFLKLNLDSYHIHCQLQFHIH